MAGEFDEFVVAVDHGSEGGFVGAAEDWHEHPVFGFDGEADIDRLGVNDFVTD